MSNRRDFITAYRNSLDDKARAEMAEMQMRTGMTDDNPLLAALVEVETRMARIEKAELRMMACAKAVVQAAEKTSAEKPAHGFEQVGDDPVLARVEALETRQREHHREIMERLARIEARLDAQASAPSLLDRIRAIGKGDQT
jgi:hypothetical protein